MKELLLLLLLLLLYYPLRMATPSIYLLITANNIILL